MPDSQLPRSWPTLASLAPPETEAAIERTFAGYRRILAQMSIPQLLDEFARTNALLTSQAAGSLDQTVRTSPPLSDWISSLDRISLRSTTTAHRPSPPDRGPARSLSRQQSPLELLSASQRLAPKIAAKLVRASAQAERRRREEA